jgi:hypothetical protein
MYRRVVDCTVQVAGCTPRGAGRMCTPRGVVHHPAGTGWVQGCSQALHNHIFAFHIGNAAGGLVYYRPHT